MKLDLDFGPQLKKILPILRRLEPYLFGLLLISVFGYTAYVVNAATNVKPAAAPETVAPVKSSKITFDKTTIESIKKLQVVDGGVDTGDLGKHDPFK